MAILHSYYVMLALNLWCLCPNGLFSIPTIKDTMYFVRNRSFETLYYCVTKDVRVNYHVLVYSRNTIHYVERFGMDDFAKEYVENALKHIDAILSSGEFMHRKLRAEFVAQERAIRELKKHNAPNREVAAMS